MSRWNQKRKRWLDRHAELCNRKGKIGSKQRLRATRSNSAGSSTKRLYAADKSPVVIQTPPKVFSLIIKKKVAVVWWVMCQKCSIFKGLRGFRLVQIWAKWVLRETDEWQIGMVGA